MAFQSRCFLTRAARGIIAKGNWDAGGMKAACATCPPQVWKYNSCRKRERGRRGGRIPVSLAARKPPARLAHRRCGKYNSRRKRGRGRRGGRIPVSLAARKPPARFAHRRCGSTIAAGNTDAGGEVEGFPSVWRHESRLRDVPTAGVVS